MCDSEGVPYPKSPSLLDSQSQKKGNEFESHSENEISDTESDVTPVPDSQSQSDFSQWKNCLDSQTML